MKQEPNNNKWGNFKQTENDLSALLLITKNTEMWVVTFHSSKSDDG